MYPRSVRGRSVYAPSRRGAQTPAHSPAALHARPGPGTHSHHRYVPCVRVTHRWQQLELPTPTAASPSTAPSERCNLVRRAEPMPFTVAVTGLHLAPTMADIDMNLDDYHTKRRQVAAKGPKVAVASAAAAEPPPPSRPSRAGGRPVSSAAAALNAALRAVRRARERAPPHTHANRLVLQTAITWPRQVSHVFPQMSNPISPSGRRNCSSHLTNRLTCATLRRRSVQCSRYHRRAATLCASHLRASLLQ